MVLIHLYILRLFIYIRSNFLLSLKEKVNSLVEILESHANRIDSRKLRAIGLRIAAENEVEQRVRQQRALQTLINERRAELDKFNLQLQALERIEAEQKAMLEKISSN
mmetsp:Transcript_18332/g.25145  ORF Transcript_18332/g.25145 Transcript_18332/m.25145 type:complete len:108 (+) Transcript_18332:1445-1768(+)